MVMDVPSQSDIPLSISSKQVSYRLMELPPEVLTLLSSSEGTRAQIRFKSTVGGNAALCLPDRAFDLRQVQTSNSVHIVKAVHGGSKDDFSIDEHGLLSIAQCGSFLELTNTSTESALPYMCQLLPIFDSESFSPPAALERKSKAEVFGDVPLSDQQCDEAWNQLCAFELPEHGLAVRPSTRILVKAWSSLLSAAILDSIDLARPVASSSLFSLADTVDEVPQALLRAVIEHLQPGEPTETIKLDQERTSRFAGRILLEDLGETTEDDLRRQWRNLLPESWGSCIKLDDLEGYYNVTNGKISSKTTASVVSRSNASTAKPQVGKRDWHSKFAQARKKP